MPDLIDAAQNEVHQVTQRVTMSTAQGGFRMATTVAKQTVVHTATILQVLASTARSALAELRDTGKVSMKELAATGTARQLVDVDDAAVAKEMERTLKRYGVTFALEKGSDGSRTFHVQGKDVQVVERALTVASERVDQRIARNETRRAISSRVDGGPDAGREESSTLTLQPGEEPTFAQARAWHKENYPQEHQQWETRYGFADTVADERRDERQLIETVQGKLDSRTQGTGDRTPVRRRTDGESKPAPKVKQDKKLDQLGRGGGDADRDRPAPRR